MIATITVQSHRMAQTQDHCFSLNSNTAGAPLPLIPRRTSSSRPALTPSPSLPLPTRNSLSTISTSTSTTITTITPATPPRNDSDSSSSSSSLSDGTQPTIRTRRVRGMRGNAVCPPELSTPIPTLVAAPTSPAPAPKHFKFPSQTDNATASTSHTAPSRPMLYTPGMPLRLSVESLKARNSPESQVLHSAETSAQGAQSASALCEPFAEERLIRKKSGQLVKSSLKSSRSVSRSNSLSVFTLSPASKSEPTTPTSKAVHFDSKLEHVKLFLAEQKPLAVSRDGSPTDDTSGTDSDFPRFIFGDGTGADDRRSKKKLVMQVPNMPERVNPNSDVALEELTLSADGTSILGKVRVRNVAFAKWVVVRFTFDSWQTTSEVTGKYTESVSEEFDRFSFSIRLNDLLARIEGKTLLMAVRYSVEGREMWDNNSGQNYLVTFTKTKVPEESRSSPVKVTTLSDDEASTDMVDLKNKLEKVVQNNDRTAPASLDQHNAQQHSRRTPTSADPDIASFRSSASFASRYDFTASLKSSWNPDAVISSPSLHTRTKSFPLSGTKSNGNSIPWPQTSPSDPYALKRAPLHPSSSAAVPMQALTPKSKPPTLGSPRDLSDDMFGNFPRPPLEFEDAPFHVEHPQPHPARNHQRGYFDLAIPAASASSKRTSPGTPTSPQRFNSFPPMEPSLSSAPATSSFLRNTPTQTRIMTTSTVITAAPRNIYGVDNGGDSELSTPSMVTPSSSPESSPSPTEVFMNLVDDENAAMSPDTHYRQFLNKFCFFTGPGSAVNPLQSEPDVEHIPRTHSASDIEEFLAGVSPRLQAIANGMDPVSPTRSPSLDDLMLNRSGSLTPTVSRLSFMNVNSQSGTPVLV